ncbi:MAG TPA: DegT/DnrJ/EryC1/StrS family aminotransferase [Acidobacteriota bacterium]|nr:DegT/DnrJ/EryC1/StrS family aminotransferase [Acidobacteriota bacterium]
MAKLALKGGDPVRKCPFPQWPEVDADDEKAVAAVVRSGKWWMYSYSARELESGAAQGGSRVEAFEAAFAEFQGVKYCLATTSGSGALEIACRAIGLQPGDEVITTPYTFIASSSCILNACAIPVFVDIDPETYNLNPSLVESAITKRTKAILPVHFGGNIADMTRLSAIAKLYGLRVIEDSAQAHGASLALNQGAGGLGDVGIFSLQQSKLLTCGEGGMVTTNNPELAELAWSLRHYGREKEGLWYEHFRLGWHYRMTELQGALLLAQLAKLPAQNEKRERNARCLNALLHGLPGIQPNRLNPETEKPAFYLVILRYNRSAWDDLNRDLLLKALQAEGIPCSGGYSFPLYENPLFTSIDFNGAYSPFRMGRERPVDFSQYRGSCPVAERACREEAIWLTHNLFLGNEEDVRDIARAFEKVYENRRELLEDEG